MPDELIMIRILEPDWVRGGDQQRSPRYVRAGTVSDQYDIGSTAAA